MKKKYQKPLLEDHTVFGICDTGSLGTAVGSGDDMAKQREFDEDNEAYNVTGGEGEASYGDLW